MELENPLVELLRISPKARASAILGAVVRTTAARFVILWIGDVWHPHRSWALVAGLEAKRYCPHPTSPTMTTRVFRRL